MPGMNHCADLLKQYGTPDSDRIFSKINISRRDAEKMLGLFIRTDNPLGQLDGLQRLYEASGYDSEVATVITAFKQDLESKISEQ
jgi:hypothetical protein